MVYLVHCFSRHTRQHSRKFAPISDTGRRNRVHPTKTAAPFSTFYRRDRFVARILDGNRRRTRILTNRLFDRERRSMSKRKRVFRFSRIVRVLGTGNRRLQTTGTAYVQLRGR